VISNQLTSEIRQGVEAGIYDLQKSTKESFKYARKCIIDPTRNDVVDTIQSHQSQVTASARTALTSLETKVEEGENDVIEEVKRGLEIASSIEQRLEVGASDAFVSTINEHRDFIEGSQWLETATEVQEKCIKNHVTKSSALISNGTNHLGGYVRDIILVGEETPDVEERNIPEYSINLTSTNEPEIILRNAGLLGDKESSMNEESAKENNENSSEPKGSQRESTSILRTKVFGALRDRSEVLNVTTGAIEMDESPPLKRAADRGQTNLRNVGNRRTSKRVKVRER